MLSRDSGVSNDDVKAVLLFLQLVGEVNDRREFSQIKKSQVDVGEGSLGFEAYRAAVSVGMQLTRSGHSRVTASSPRSLLRQAMITFPGF